MCVCEDKDDAVAEALTIFGVSSNSFGSSISLSVCPSV